MISAQPHQPTSLYWCPECKRYFEATTALIHQIRSHGRES